jgi:hypothetical protein
VTGERPAYATTDIWNPERIARVGRRWDRRALAAEITQVEALAARYAADAAAYVAACRARLDALAAVEERQVVAIRYDDRRFTCSFTVDVAALPVVGGVRRDGILIPLPPHPRRAEFCDGSWNGTGHACIRDVRDHALALARDLGLPIWVDDLPRRLAFPKDCGIEVIRPR